MKKLYCKACGGILIPVAEGYICEDCKKKYSNSDLKAMSMQINVKAPALKKKEEEKPFKLEVKKPLAKKDDTLIKDIKPTLKLKMKAPKIDEVVEIKKPKAVKPIGEGKDPKNGPSNNIKLKAKIKESDMLNSFLILAKDAMDKNEYENAISYSEKILRMDIKNRNAYLIKAEAIINMDISIDERLEEAIKYYSEALANTEADYYEDLEFRIHFKYIEVVKNYLLDKLAGFKETIDSRYLDILKAELKHLDKFARAAAKKINLDIKLYYEALAEAVISLVSKVSTKAIKAFNLEKMRQTDEAYLDFKNKMDGCIGIWEYILSFAIKANTILEALDSLYKAHYAIINSCGHKLSGKTLRVSICATNEEKLSRENRFNSYKDKIRSYYLTEDDQSSYSDYQKELKNLESKRKALAKKANSFKEIKEIEELKEENNELIKSFKYEECKANLKLINTLSRNLLEKSKDINLEIEKLDRKILYISIDNMYMNLD